MSGGGAPMMGERETGVEQSRERFLKKKDFICQLVGRHVAISYHASRTLDLKSSLFFQGHSFPHLFPFVDTPK